MLGLAVRYSDERDERASVWVKSAMPVVRPCPVVSIAWPAKRATSPTVWAACSAASPTSCITWAAACSTCAHEIEPLAVSRSSNATRGNARRGNARRDGNGDWISK